MPYRPGERFFHTKHEESDREYNRIYNASRPERHELYKTTRWSKLRKLKLDHSPLCEECLKKGVYTPATLVHHKIEVKENEDLMFDYDNLESLCAACHNRIHHNLHKQQEQSNDERTHRYHYR